MSRPRVLFLLAIGLALAVHPMLAATSAVGTCKPSLPSFTTISAAVSTVPPGSTVLVCPGTYSEQVTIAQPLTLKGITSGNAGQAVITVPGSGLAVVTTGFGDQIAAGQLVGNPSPFNFVVLVFSVAFGFIAGFTFDSVFKKLESVQALKTDV